MYDGIINIYKEKGFTSHDVVAKLRGILKMKKIGHTGTLDPDAEGVLPVCVGKATKLCELLLEKSKTYEATCVLGLTTDTQDMSGKVLRESAVDVTKEDIENAVKAFIGGYDQIPPMYSALKVNGKKLYELAREGKEVERKPRRVVLDNIDIIDISDDLKHITIRVDCSKGTYIRTLCHDIGEKLGCGACMETLLRTKVDMYELDNALKLCEVETLVEEDNLSQHLVSIEDILKGYPKVNVVENADKLLYNGNKLNFKSVVPRNVKESVRVYDSKDNFVALYEYDNKYNEYKPIKMFL